MTRETTETSSTQSAVGSTDRLGLALAFIPMSIGALTGVQPAEAGVASGLINTSQQVGGAVGVAIATTIATSFTSRYVDDHAGSNAFSGPALTHGFQIALRARWAGGGRCADLCAHARIPPAQRSRSCSSRARHSNWRKHDHNDAQAAA
jgi:hypothetical protein